MAEPKRPRGHGQSRTGMGLQQGVFGSRTCIPLMGSHWLTSRAQRKMCLLGGGQAAHTGGCRCLVKYCSLVCKGGENQAHSQPHCSDPPSSSGTRTRSVLRKQKTQGRDQAAKGRGWAKNLGKFALKVLPDVPTKQQKTKLA